MDVKISNSWKEHLQPYFDSPSFNSLAEFVKRRYHETTVYPAPDQIFNAFKLCPFEQVRVVILGQDPYHSPGAAEGLAFSVAHGKPQPSLRNIFKEIENDTGSPSSVLPSTSLETWAKQGVLLLNSVLTVEKGLPASHADKGWEEFTDFVIKKISEENDHVVFILWGAYAQRKGSNIDRDKHLVIESPHPSPFSAHRGFFGSKPFSKTNQYLIRHDKDPIEW